MRFGLHTGQQQCSIDDLRRVWQLAEQAGFDAIFTSDHFYPIPKGDGSVVAFEPTATLAALAFETTRVTIGCLVWAMGFRSPGLIAKTMATIDHWSGGRSVVGLGAGAMAAEYKAFGYEFPDVAFRMGQLEEACIVIPGLLHNDRFSYEGRYFTIDDVALTPRPGREKIPLWIGGRGLQRLVPIAARYADVYNGNNMTPDEFQKRLTRLDEILAAQGRSSSQVARSISVGFYMGTTNANAADYRAEVDASYLRRDEVLLGTVNEVVDQVGAYQEAGCQQVNLNVFGNYPPFDLAAIERFASEVIPQFV